MMASRHDHLSVPAFLASVGVATTVVQYGRGDALFTQGDPCEDVWYIESGHVKLSVLSKVGKECSAPETFLAREAWRVSRLT
jgi:CRP-like cAMP-binding protein